MRTRPGRLVDVVVYGGPHYDPLLELRMHELRDLAQLFVVIEHDRPSPRPSAHRQPSSGTTNSGSTRGGAGAEAGRRFDPTRARFARFASRVRHVRLGPPASGAVDEFVDLELQGYWARQRALNSFQLGYTEAGAQEGDLVLVSDIDEIPRAAALARMLRDQTTLARLHDATAFALTGPVMYYHPRCRATARATGPAHGPRLLSGEALLHFGGGQLRDYAAKQAGGRLPLVEQRDASVHLRYFMRASEIRSAMCARLSSPQPEKMVDADEWWIVGVLNASKLCHQPELIRSAMRECADLWHRPARGGFARTYETRNEDETGLEAWGGVVQI